MGRVEHVGINVKDMYAVLLNKVTLPAMFGAAGLSLFFVWILQNFFGKFVEVQISQGITLLMMLSIPVVAMAIIKKYTDLNSGTTTIPYAGLVLILILFGLLYFVQTKAPEWFSVFSIGGLDVTGAMSMVGL